MFKVGSVVFVTAGKEKGCLFAIIGKRDNLWLISDGKTRRLNKPKQKSEKHFSQTDFLLESSCFSSNRELRRALALIKSELNNTVNEEE